MNSFISNFKREAGVLAAVLLALLACELGLRASIRRSSVDARHIEDIPRIVGEKPDVLFLGNSLTRAGVIPQALDLGGASVGLIHPDDTTIVDWLYLYKTRVPAGPKLLVVGFAADQLSDSTELQVDRLALLAGPQGLPEAFRFDVRGFDDRVSYLLGLVSCAYANRQRIRAQVSAALIPGYKASAQVLNRGFRDAPARPRPRTYARLERFLRLLESRGAKVVFVAMPVPKLNPIDPALAEVLSAHGVRLVDLRRVEGLTPKHFPDGYHLSPAGGEVFSRRLALELKTVAATGR